MKRFIQLLAVVILNLVLVTTVTAAPRDSRVAGGIALIELEQTAAPRFKFHGQPVLTAQIEGKLLAVVGIPLSAKPGDYYIEGRYGSEQALRKKYFTVADKQYSTQHIEIRDQRKVNPYARDMERIMSEKKRKIAARNTYTEKLVNVDFVQPVEGIMTGSFGRRRVFNGQPRRPHSGMDIAAAEGTPIRSPGSGRVIELGDFFFSGNLIYIDHGQGLISMFAHLSEINVAPGQTVEKGQIIGKVGQTGRVTGPHLHWSLAINRNWIDPALFLP